MTQMHCKFCGAFLPAPGVFRPNERRIIQGLVRYGVLSSEMDARTCHKCLRRNHAQPERRMEPIPAPPDDYYSSPDYEP